MVNSIEYMFGYERRYDELGVRLRPNLIEIYGMTVSGIFAG
jgi:hypothetical protein